MFLDDIAGALALMFLIVLACGFVLCAINGLLHFVKEFKAASRERIHAAVRDALYEVELARAANERRTAHGRAEDQSCPTQ